KDKREYLREHRSKPNSFSVVATTDETITDANHRLDAIAALVEFLPQAANVHIERARVAIITVAPNAIQQLLSRHDVIGAPGQHREQRELLVRQLDAVAVANDAN